MASVASGKRDPLTVPADARISTDDKGVKRSRWTERGVVSQAYRTISKSKLMDVVVVVKLRQSKTAKNNGAQVWSHFYLNQSENISEGHEIMNNMSVGALGTMLVATGFMPAGGSLRGSLLDKMFPKKGQPGTSSPLQGKAVVVNVVQELAQRKDFKTNKLVTDDEGNPVMQKKDSGESFLPEPKAADAVAAEGEEESEEEGEEEGEA
jgi:hypothetical protein